MKTLAGAAAVPVIGAARGSVPALRLVVLDLGGTIIEDRGDLPEALRSAMAHHGVTVSLAEINQWRGASKREIVRHFVKEEKLGDEIYREFTANLIQIYQGVPPIAGVEAAFRALRDGGLLLAANTGFDRPIMNSIFQRLGWEKYFAATVCSDDVAQGRPSPFLIFHAMETARVNNVAEVAVVGDTPLDLQAGTNAGARAVIGVLSGIGTRERLRTEPHTQILGSVADLPSYLLKNGRPATGIPASPARPA